MSKILARASVGLRTWPETSNRLKNEGIKEITTEHAGATSFVSIDQGHQEHCQIAFRLWPCLIIIWCVLVQANFHNFYCARITLWKSLMRSANPYLMEMWFTYYNVMGRRAISKNRMIITITFLNSVYKQVSPLICGSLYSWRGWKPVSLWCLLKLFLN